MPIRDTAAMNASLDADYATRATSLALFDGDPMVPVDEGGGVELTTSVAPGYARAAVPASAWKAAADGLKSTNVLTFANPTGEWTVTVTHWGLIDGAGVMWDCGPLSDPLDVTGAGDGPQLVVSVFYDDNVEGDED